MFSLVRGQAEEKYACVQNHCTCLLHARAAIAPHLQWSQASSAGYLIATHDTAQRGQPIGEWPTGDGDMRLASGCM